MSKKIAKYLKNFALFSTCLMMILTPNTSYAKSKVRVKSVVKKVVQKGNIKKRGKKVSSLSLSNVLSFSAKGAGKAKVASFDVEYDKSGKKVTKAIVSLPEYVTDTKIITDGPIHYFVKSVKLSYNGKTKSGDKYAIQPAGATVTWLAGLYRMENGFPYFTILTREPSGELSRIHDRMPLILPENVLGAWTNPNTDTDTVKEIASSALTDMIFEKL